MAALCRWDDGIGRCYGDAASMNLRETCFRACQGRHSALLLFVLLGRGVLLPRRTHHGGAAQGADGGLYVFENRIVSVYMVTAPLMLLRRRNGPPIQNGRCCRVCGSLLPAEPSN